MKRLTRRKTLLPSAGGAAAVTVATLAPTLAGDIRDSRQRREVAHEGRALFTGYRYVNATGPARTLVYDSRSQLVATLTVGSRSVLFVGPSRRFAEPATTPAYVDSSAWVLLAPAAWTGKPSTAFHSWFTATLAQVRGGRAHDRDALSVAMEYVTGGVHDIGFGPIKDGGSRDNQSDFFDALGISWKWADGTTSQPDPAFEGYDDCSGLLRLVWGYRLGMPMVKGAPVKGVTALPRYARQIADSPAAVVFSNRTHEPSADELARLQPGDLVFFAQTKDPAYISHCGMVLGRDDAGRTRFVSSRAVVNGPSMGDNNHRGVLDGEGFYAEHLRRAIRL